MESRLDRGDRVIDRFARENQIRSPLVSTKSNETQWVLFVQRDSLFDKDDRTRKLDARWNGFSILWENLEFDVLWLKLQRRRIFVTMFLNLTFGIFIEINIYIYFSIYSMFFNVFDSMFFLSIQFFFFFQTKYYIHKKGMSKILNLN